MLTPSHRQGTSFIHWFCGSKASLVMSLTNVLTELLEAFWPWGIFVPREGLCSIPAPGQKLCQSSREAGQGKEMLKIICAALALPVIFKRKKSLKNEQRTAQPSCLSNGDERQGRKVLTRLPVPEQAAASQLPQYIPVSCTQLCSSHPWASSRVFQEIKNNNSEEVERNQKANGASRTTLCLGPVVSLQLRHGLWEGKGLCHQ